MLNSLPRITSLFFWSFRVERKSVISTVCFSQSQYLASRGNKQVVKGLQGFITVIGKLSEKYSRL